MMPHLIQSCHLLIKFPLPEITVCIRQFYPANEMRDSSVGGGGGRCLEAPFSESQLISASPVMGSYVRSQYDTFTHTKPHMEWTPFLTLQGGKPLQPSCFKSPQTYRLPIVAREDFCPFKGTPEDFLHRWESVVEGNMIPLLVCCHSSQLLSIPYTVDWHKISHYHSCKIYLIS